MVTLHVFLCCGELLVQRYCHGDNSLCARYLVCQSLGPQRIPDDLFPGDILKAKTIISFQ